MRRYLSISCCKDKHFFSNTKSFCQKNSCPLKTLPFISYVLIHQCFGKKQKILVHGCLLSGAAIPLPSHYSLYTFV